MSGPFERRGNANAGPSDGTSKPSPTPIEIRPEEVIQKDARPWRRITLDGVVFRTIATSAAALALLLVLGFAVLRALGIL